MLTPYLNAFLVRKPAQTTPHIRVQNRMANRKLLYEGKAKIIFGGLEDDALVQYFKDDATAFNAKKKDVIKGKGILNNYISEHIMVAVGNLGIPNHFISRLNERDL